MSVIRVIAIALAVVLLAGQAQPADAALRKIALGVSILDDTSVAALDAETAAIGRNPAIWTVWSDWGGPDRDFPTAFMNVLKGRGIVPMVNWQPTAPGSGDCTLWSLDNILEGDYDAYIRQWALAAKAYGATVLLRFAHEMNGYWFVWGYSRCDNTPAKFRAAWKHVWNIFRGPGGVGATNVKFMWAIVGVKRLSAHYPGNKYVDYLGLSAFNWGPPRRSWRTMVRVLVPGMRALQGLSTKPIIVAELGSAHKPRCAACDKAAWIRNGYPAAYKKWPRIKAIVYFDIDMRFVGQPDWRLNQPAGALQAYRAIVNDTRFQGQLP